MSSGTETVQLEPDRLGVVFGRAFLVAIARHDAEQAMVFARSLLTKFPQSAAHPL